MKFQIAIALFLMLSVAEAGFAGGWMRQSTELTEDKRVMINFGLKKISEKNSGFQALEFQPVKILDMQTQVVAGINTKILVELDNGQHSFDSKKLLQVIIYTELNGENQLSSWTVLDSDTSFQELTSKEIREGISRRISGALAYEDVMDKKPMVRYEVNRILAAYQTTKYGQTLYYVKAKVQGTDNSVKIHEFWFANDNYDVFAHVQLPMKRMILENHPKLTLIRDTEGVHCENLASYFFCKIAHGCLNNVLESGKCENAVERTYEMF